MESLKLKDNLRGKIDEFVRGLEDVYKEDLVSVILYGSAASGEFVDEHSNLNLLIVLKDAGLENIKKSAAVVNKGKFRMFMPLFFNRDYITSSTDVFPVEFLDMKENYVLLAGEDVLKDITVDLKNLRFQCEHELKAKLISLRQFFLKNHKDRAILRNALFKTVNSVTHILRNIVRIKGKNPAYLKQDIIKQAEGILPMESGVWQRILAAKNKQVKLAQGEIEQLFIKFVEELEKIIVAVDRL